jgi:2-phospho-L-lactate guanylyltransferase
MTRLAIVIPVKSLLRGKSRLAGVLSPWDRYALNLRLLRHTFAEVSALTDIADIHVVSSAADVLAEAAQRGFKACAESEPCTLNKAVALGALQAITAGATEVMVLPIDLPWLSAQRIRQVIDEFHAGSDVMIITDHVGDGSNLLLWRPIETARFHYGPGSAARHVEVASELGLRVTLRQDRHLSFDLDQPRDLEAWARDARVAPHLAAPEAEWMVS